MRVLNRFVHWTEEGIEYEADQRHAEIIIQELGLKEESKSVNTPGEPNRKKGTGKSVNQSRPVKTRGDGIREW